MADQKTVDRIVKIVNKSKAVINSGQIRIMPAGSPGDSIELPESKISEGLKRLLALPGSGLEKVTA